MRTSPHTDAATAPPSSSDLSVRPLGPDESRAALDLLGFVFADPVEDADAAAEATVFEPDRSLGTFDGDRLVGTLGTYSFQMSVPGGTLPVAGTTWVGVLPTHRRRGVLRGAVQRHLADVAEREEPLAALWASETAIYGRFGYGPAIDTHRLRVAVGDGLRWADHAPDPAATVSLVPVEEAQPVLDPIWQAVRTRRAGMHARSPEWWAFQALSEREHARGGATSKHVAVAEVDGVPAAYAIYGADEGWDDHGRPTGVLTALEVAGVDPAAEAAMWRYLAGHDLMAWINAPRRPVDDALPLLLADSRRVRRTRADGLHVRVVDVVAALQGRGYADSAGFTVEVVDDLLDRNDDTWRVEVAPEGASVTRDATATPDLRMPVLALGALYMGDVGVRHLVAAGLVEVANPAVLTALDSALRAPEAGWAAEVW